MRHFFKFFACFLAFTAVFICSVTAGGKAEAENKNWKIGVSLPTLQEERWQNDNRYFREEADKLRNIQLFIQVADNSADKQFSQIENLMTQGIDALIVGAVDTFAIGPVIERAHRAGIKIIAYSRIIQNATVDVLILFDPYQVQDKSIKLALSLVPKGNYVLLAGDQTTLPEAVEYRRAWYDNLNPYINRGDIKVILDQFNENWAPEKGLANTENALVMANNNISAVICANDGIAGGAIQALGAKNLEGKVVVTGNDADINGLKRIIEGTQTSTILQNTRNQVRISLETALKLLNNEKIDNAALTFNNGKIDIPAVAIDVDLITKDNLDALVIDSGIRTREQVYGK
jgi:D-xylose transport system substrate-binding protein